MQLGLRRWRPQSDGDIVRQVVTSEGEHRGVDHGAIDVDDDVCRTAADVDERHAQLSLVAVEARFGGCDLRQDDVGDGQAAPLRALDDVLSAHAVAPVTMWTLDSSRTPLMPIGSRTPSCASTTNSCGMVWRISRSGGIGIALAASSTRSTSSWLISPPLGLTATMPVEFMPLDVSPGDARVDRRNLAASHVLGLLDGLVDRGDGVLDVDHHAFDEATRGVGANSNDVDAVVGHFADHRGDLGRADVETNDDFLALSHPFHPRPHSNAGLLNVPQPVHHINQVFASPERRIRSRTTARSG